jgi:hypothetical protein
MAISAGALLIIASPPVFPGTNAICYNTELRTLDRVLLQLIDHDCVDCPDHRYQRIFSFTGYFGINACMILFGALQEKYEEPGKPSWIPFWFGSFAGIIPWIAIIVYVISPGREVSPPGFVYGIIVSCLFSSTVLP